MASKEVFVLVAYLLCRASAEYCVKNSDCSGIFEKCCSDLVCRESCSYCVLDSQCGSGECCNSDNNCYDCALTTASIAGIAVGTVVFIVIIVSIVSCCCCACCPYYRYRNPGAVIVASPAGYNQFVNVTSTTSTHQCNQQPPAPGYAAQPPPYYPPQQAGPYLPPPQGSAMASYPPPGVKGPYPQAH